MYPLPKEDSGAWKIILVGCLVILVLGVLVTAGSCYFVFKSGGDLMEGLSGVMIEELRDQKASYMNKLTDDHAEEERERFGGYYARLVDEYERLGLIKWSMKYGDVFADLENISSDGFITRDESEMWMAMAKRAFESTDPAF